MNWLYTKLFSIYALGLTAVTNIIYIYTKPVLFDSDNLSPLFLWSSSRITPIPRLDNEHAINFRVQSQLCRELSFRMKNSHIRLYDL